MNEEYGLFDSLYETITGMERQRIFAIIQKYQDENWKGAAVNETCSNLKKLIEDK